MVDTSIERKKGTTHPIITNLQDADGFIDMTTATDIAMNLADKPEVGTGGGGSTVAILQGVVGDNPVGGEVKFTPNADYLALPPGRYYGEIEYTLGGETYCTDTFEFRLGARLA